jgi:hypothetical protein
VAVSPAWQQAEGVLRVVRIRALTGEDLDLALADILARLTDIEDTLVTVPTADQLDTIIADQDALTGYIGGIATSQLGEEGSLNTILPLILDADAIMKVGANGVWQCEMLMAIYRATVGYLQTVKVGVDAGELPGV